MYEMYMFVYSVVLGVEGEYFVLSSTLNPVLPFACTDPTR